MRLFSYHANGWIKLNNEDTHNRSLERLCLRWEDNINRDFKEIRRGVWTDSRGGWTVV
jgi:hypothetical protein